MDNTEELFNIYINNPKILKMNTFKQHGYMTTYDHSVHVVNVGLELAKKLKCSTKQMENIIIGGILHDYFLYDYHVTTRRLPDGLHAWAHPIIALRNANNDFKLNNIQQNIIVSHMFPMTLFHIPKYKEAWIICLVDKYCAIIEYLNSIAYNVKLLYHKEQKVY